jgi:hypothetical protein
MASQSIVPAPEGRTRWRRFGVVGAVGFAAVGVIGYLAMTGALALSFAISGIPFTLSADSLTGTHFVQYAYPDTLASGSYAPLLNAKAGAVVGTGPITNTATIGGNTYASDTVTQFQTATIANLNQVICAPTPLGNAIKVHLSGTGNTQATNLVIQAPALSATSANFGNITIGESVSSAISAQGVTDPYGAMTSSLGASFAQGADTATLTGITQVGVGTEAGSFNISGLKLYAEFVPNCNS